MKSKAKQLEEYSELLALVRMISHMKRFYADIGHDTPEIKSKLLSLEMETVQLILDLGEHEPKSEALNS